MNGKSALHGLLSIDSTFVLGPPPRMRSSGGTSGLMIGGSGAGGMFSPGTFKSGITFLSELLKSGQRLLPVSPHLRKVVTRD
jgi:hypothetical protein